MTSLTDHARRELDLCGESAQSPEYVASLLNAIEAFTAYDGHSGASHDIARHQLHTLLGYGTLSPLTDDPAEWMDIDGKGLLQNRRNPAAFSTDAGATYTLTSEKSKTHTTLRTK